MQFLVNKTIKTKQKHIFVILLSNIQYSQKHTMINHCDRRITHLSDTDTVQSETYHDKSL